VPEIVNERRRQQRAVDTRERILEAAFSEFAERGYEGTSTRTVATMAGVQHPLVTYHFKSKEGLWRAVVGAVRANFSDRFNAHLSSMRDVDEVSTLRRVQEDFIRFSASNPGFHWLMANEGNRPSERLDWLVENNVKGYFTVTARLIRAAQKAGRYVEGDPEHLQYLFIGAVTRIFMQSAEAERVLGRSPFSPAFVERHVKSCCALFFRDPPNKARAAPAGRRAAVKKPAARTGKSGTA
jgi:AcrR family transcriptional regulator